ncbi:MAG: efflux RND transporter periplasmic adaptor subunit [Moorellales bacterium]
MRAWWRITAAAVVAAALALGGAACGVKSAQGPAPELPVKTVTAALGPVDVVVELTGTLLPARSANVSGKLAGRVAEVRAEVGDAVKAGQVLVRIDTAELQAQWQQAEAAVSLAEAQADQAGIALDTARLKVEAAQIDLDNARKAYDRVKSLADAGAAPQSQLDEVEARLKQAQTQYRLAVMQEESARRQYAIATGPALAQARAAQNLIRVQMKNAEVCSPLSGVVTNRYVNPGEVVGAGTPLLTVADTSSLKLQGTVSQEVVPLLAVGQKVSVTVDALPGAEFEGRVTQVGPVAAATGQRFPVEVTLSNPGRLAPGMSARAVLKLAGPEGVLVPVSALRSEGGETFVFVVDNGNVVRRRAVTLGLRGEEKATVVTGLAAGERVAVTNVEGLQDGAAVTPQ